MWLYIDKNPRVPPHSRISVQRSDTDTTSLDNAPHGYAMVHVMGRPDEPMQTPPTAPMSTSAVTVQHIHRSVYTLSCYVRYIHLSGHFLPSSWVQEVKKSAARGSARLLSPAARHRRSAATPVFPIGGPCWPERANILAIRYLGGAQPRAYITHPFTICAVRTTSPFRRPT